MMRVIRVTATCSAAVLAGFLLALPPVGTALAQDGTGRVADGRSIAETWCMRCHVIGTGNQPEALVGAPSFVALAERQLSRDALAFALLNPHPVMPKFELSRDAIRSLSEYIDTLDE